MPYHILLKTYCELYVYGKPDLPCGLILITVVVLSGLSAVVISCSFVVKSIICVVWSWASVVVSYNTAILIETKFPSVIKIIWKIMTLWVLYIDSINIWRKFLWALGSRYYLMVRDKLWLCWTKICHNVTCSFYIIMINSILLKL